MSNPFHPENALLRTRYRILASFYDILDLPWELSFYRHMRPALLNEISGEVLEAGVGTGRNLPYYSKNTFLKGVDLSPEMLTRARSRARRARCQVELYQTDATRLKEFTSNTLDWYVSTFMYCVMPDDLQPQAIAEMARVLKPGGRFRLVEITYSKTPKLLRRQRILSGFVERVYGARFDRQTLRYIQNETKLEITKTRFLKEDTYLLIEGRKRTV